MSILKKINSYLLPLFIFVHSKPVFAQLRDWDADLDPDPLVTRTCMVNGVPTFSCLEIVIGNILYMSNVFILLVIFIMFVIGSFKYLTSLGNAEKIEEAKGTFKWAIIGLVVYLSAYLVLKIIDVLFLGNTGAIFELKIGE
jgi:hypothetical protein